MLTARCCLSIAVAAILGCHHSSPRESDILGTWRYTTIDNVGVMTFGRDHHVTLAFGLDSPDLPGLTIVGEGPWKLKGSDLSYELHFVAPHSDVTSAPVPKKVETLTIREVHAEKLVFLQNNLTFERVR
jgi:hypothetical protein